MAQKWIVSTFGSLDGLELIVVDPPAPKADEVTIQVKAVGMNPVDVKTVLTAEDPGSLMTPLGYEVAGIITAAGADAPFAPGDEVIAFRVTGGYATELTVPAKDVFAKPESLGWPEAANLLLAGATAAEMLHVTGAKAGETILVHGASGAVGVSVLQQAALWGIRCIGTASERTFGVVEEFGATGVVYGGGLEERVRSLAPDGIAAALDCVGTDEAIDVSIALVEDRGRIVSIAAFGRAERDGYRVIGGAMPESARYRDEIRSSLVALAGKGDLVVPVAKTFPFAEAPAALELLATGHPGGKLALVP
ncbi:MULTISPECIES: NADP-dependent oxidoreductase [unclassified Frondihabitans]|uniref:quinone oxidoreductase family protein n=1 Tax=unclassified Frondihabitans TaxID=2626248 RepID=UPI000F505E7A|nr:MULTISPECIES: NADP-dependent oxidoreductase [unclassified Frondihabitans]RPE77549.1 NADPH:quinone reductase-like Zn-dependent oxidoreductase [Frondihabitans sp. PhB153]RPF07826.1 NADPH:quinone reductase-like Zn-dependent oxidoreductase [Frondihabitans sp. PhB161]